MPNSLKDFLPLFDKLTIESKPVWGKMTAQHMVEHLIFAVRMSNRKLKLECFNPPEKLPTLKKFVLSTRPLPRNFINPIIGEDLLPLQYESLEKAKETLTAEIADYYKFFDDNPNAITTNVTFGDLNKNEWGVFHRKHFTHHLQQFGFTL